MGEKIDVRDCENCKNYVAWDDRPEIKSCRKWECEYEPIARWIPCSERMPETEKAVLVTDQSEEVYIASRIDIYDEILWWLQDYGRINVIAWMPLPEPYKEGDDDV